MPYKRSTWLDWAFAGYARREAERAAAKAANPVQIAAEVAVEADSGPATAPVVEAKVAVDYGVFWERLDKYGFYPASIIAGISWDTSVEVRAHANTKVVAGATAGAFGWATGSETAKEVRKDLYNSAKRDYETARKLEALGILGAAIYFASIGTIVGIYWTAEQGLFKPIINFAAFIVKSVVNFAKLIVNAAVAVIKTLIINPIKAAVKFCSDLTTKAYNSLLSVLGIKPVVYAKNDWDPRFAQAEVVAPPVPSATVVKPPANPGNSSWFGWVYTNSKTQNGYPCTDQKSVTTNSHIRRLTPL